MTILFYFVNKAFSNHQASTVTGNGIDPTNCLMVASTFRTVQPQVNLPQMTSFELPSRLLFNRLLHLQVDFLVQATWPPGMFHTSTIKKPGTPGPLGP